MKTWNDAIELVTHLPESYLPGLIAVIVKVAYGKGVFQPGGVSRFIQKIEADLPPNTKLNPKQPNCTRKSCNNPAQPDCFFCSESCRKAVEG